MNDLSKMTSILVEDTAATLHMMGCIQIIDGVTTLYTTESMLDELMIKFPLNGLQVDVQYLQWSPLYITDCKKDKWAIRAKKDKDITSADMAPGP